MSRRVVLTGIAAVTLSVGAIMIAFEPLASEEAGGAPGDVTAGLLADIYPGATSSNPNYLTNVNGTLYFSASDGVNGLELWISDGTSAGTRMIDDDDPSDGGIAPGPTASVPVDLANLNGAVLFGADDGTSGRRLWKSDGTAAGTTMVGSASDPRGLTNVNGTLFFRASGAGGTELWRSDGTPDGTTMVADINPTGNSNPSGFTNVNGTVFFQATDGTNGVELWKSASPYTSASMVDDDDPADGGINPGAGSNPEQLTAVDGKLLFQATDGTNGIELWKSDGTAAGTKMVDDDDPADGGINPGGSSSPQYLANLNGTLLFQADDGTNGAELWKSDGTAAGTRMVDDDDPADGGIMAGAPGSSPAYLTRMGGAVFFAAGNVDNVDPAQRNVELWRTDGTSAGTTMVSDVNPSEPSWGSEPYGLIDANGTLYFGAHGGGETGFELWRSDGTDAGTEIVEDAVPGGGIRPGGDGSQPYLLTNVNGTVFLEANDGSHGYEVWRTYVEAPPAEPTPPTPAPTTTVPGPTGQRAGALSKCKKKKTAKARKKCKKKAKKLPL